MFRTGQWMVENGQIPTTDVFSYTLSGTEWISVKWLFELLAYGFAVVSGPESIGILQGLVNILLAFFFLKITQNLTQLVYEIKINLSHPILILTGTIFLFAIDYRLIGRPEMFSHLFTIIYIHLFVQYKLKPGNFIFWLIPLQIIWVNIHEGFAIGMVLIITFGLGYWIDNFLSKKLERKFVNRILFASGLALLAVAINPRGFYMFYHPYFLFSVVGSNHYTNELNSVFYRPGFYFSFKEPYFAFLAAIIGFTGSFWLFTQEKVKFFMRFGSGYIGVLIAFTYLAMTGYRNVIFLTLAAFPIASAILVKLWASQKDKNLVKYLVYPMGVLPLLFYFLIVTNQYYDKFSNSKERYGLAIYANSNPTGAAKFAKENELETKRCFSDYLSSAYFLWELRPHFESYIDLRDLDIFPKEFFDDFIRITHYTNYFDDSDTKYNYEYAMLYTWQFPNLHRYLYHSPKWKQVYADNVACVYVKNTPDNQKIISKFTPDSTNLFGNFNASFQPEPTAISNGISFLFWPGYQLESHLVDSSIMASKYFRIVADFDRAEFHAQNAIKNKLNAYEGYAELGNMYLEIVPFKPTQEGKLTYINMANNAFSKGVVLDKSKWECVYGQASCAFMTQDYGYALKLFKKAATLAPEKAENYLRIADCYGNLYQKSNSMKEYDFWFENMEKALKIDPDNQQIIAKLGVAYCQSNQCEMAKPLLEKYERMTDVSEQDHQEVIKCIQKCNVK